MDPYRPTNKGKDGPYRRVIELTLVDKHTKRTVRLDHECDVDPDVRELKKDLQGKVGVLLDALWPEKIDSD
jgi:hypothetical protein